MKLKKYDVSVNTGRSVEPTISFSDSGVIRISKSATDALNIKAGDRLSLFQDEDSPTDWYLSKDKDGFPTRPGSTKDSGSVQFNSANTRNDFYQSLFDQDDQFQWPRKFRIATEPTIYEKKLYYAILLPKE